MGSKSKGGGTGRGTGSKGWTRWNKTAKPKPVKSGAPGAPGAPGAKGAGAAKGITAKRGGNKGGSSK